MEILGLLSGGNQVGIAMEKEDYGALGGEPVRLKAIERTERFVAVVEEQELGMECISRFLQSNQYVYGY